MAKLVAVNGSPRGSHGNTQWILEAFLQGAQEAGGETELFFTNDLEVKPCDCGMMYCWYHEPGECCNQDDMQMLYPKIRQAETLVLATPIYIPLPGAMQNLVNRLCPLIRPELVFRDGRTRAVVHEGTRLKRIVLVSTGGWWEKANFEVVEAIVRELAENSSLEYGGSILRPHAFLMKEDGIFTEAGQKVLEASREAGRQLTADGKIKPEVLDAVSEPLIPMQDLIDLYNQWVFEASN
ncbi:MAG: flavodoxin family protein [Anaerolineales bacterium]|nr:flavodoxin family protein [Anaerolineales bacterium]